MYRKNSFICFLLVLFLSTPSITFGGTLTAASNPTKKQWDGNSHSSCELYYNITRVPRWVEKLRHRLPTKVAHRYAAGAGGGGGRYSSDSTIITYQNPKVAYKMAIMASMAYWEFHKWNFPKEAEAPNGNANVTRTTGFRLHQDRYPRLSKKGRILYQACRLKAKAKSLKVKANSLFQKFARSSTSRSHSLSSPPSRDGKNEVESTDIVCEDRKTKKPDSKRYSFQYFFYNWHETTIPTINFHDTDLLISTSDDDQELVIAFAGSASPADAVTNLQTFEPANHSGFFDNQKKTKNRRQNVCADSDGKLSSSCPADEGILGKNIQGSIHRGMLNAYTRVTKGSVLRLNPNSTTNILPVLHDKFGHCVRGEEASSSSRKEREDHNQLDDEMEADASSNVKERRKGGCKVRDEKLVNVLRKVVIDALQSGRKVRLTGHSLGGGLATLLALDIVINFPTNTVPISNLELTTFGEPQIADDIFFRSVMELLPPSRRQRFQSFLESKYHRYVTISNKCQVDLISQVAKNTLPSHKENLHGKSARALGGVRGNLIHFVEPHYLLTPEQYDSASSSSKTTDNAISAHSLTNYLKGISRESRHHPLSSDLPEKVSAFLGEATAQ